MTDKKKTVTAQEAYDLVWPTISGAFTPLGQTAQLIVDALTPLKGISTNSDGPGADPYRDPQWLLNYDGQSIFKLTSGLYWVFNTGCWETIEAARDSIDRWRERHEADVLDGDLEDPNDDFRLPSGENTF